MECTLRFKVVFVDHDGTLVGPEFEISDRLNAAVQTYQAQGGRICLATGKLFPGVIQQTAASLRLSGPHIVNGGAEIVSADGALLMSYALPASYIPGICGVLENYEFYPEVYQGETVYTNQPAEMKRPHKTYAILADLKLDQGTIPRIRFLFTDAQEAQATEAVKALRGFNLASVLRSDTTSTMGYDITSIWASKEAAVRTVLLTLDLDARNSVAIGDGYNDLGLLQASGYRVAMGNAVEELKALAHFIAPSCTEDGVAHVLELIADDKLP